MQKVSLYIRHSGTRKYEKANPKALPTYQGKLLPDATFVLRYVRDGKRVFETLKDCPDLKTAHERRLTREIDLLRGTSAAPAPRPAPTPKPVTPAPTEASPGTLTLDAAIDRYLENVALKSSKTPNGYGYTLQQFYKSGGNKPLTEISKQDLYDFIAYLRREELSDRTIHNRVGEVVTFLRHFGIKDVTLRVKFTEKKIRSYRADEIKAMFAVADPEETILLHFFLCTGARDQEVANAEWDDLDFVDGLYTTVDLTGANGIMEKISKFGGTPRRMPRKLIHIGGYLGAIRNAADHGPDGDINNDPWEIRDATALEYVFVACSFIAATIGIERNQPPQI